MKDRAGTNITLASPYARDESTHSPAALLVVGPASMAGQLLAEHLGAAAPHSWEDVDLADLDHQTAVIIDGSLGTEHPGISQFIAALRRNNVGVIVAFCSDDNLTKAQWVEHGVHAVVIKTASLDELGDVIRRIRSGDTVMGVSVREALLSELRVERLRTVEHTSSFDDLTKREAGVLRELALGRSPEEIARANYVSLNTIRTQIRGILAKLGTGSVVGSVALAYRRGWIVPD